MPSHSHFSCEHHDSYVQKLEGNGNLTSDGVQTFTWNKKNQLESSGSLTFAYDPSGRRYKTVDRSSGKAVYTFYPSPYEEIRDATSTSSGTPTYYIFAGGQRIASYEDSDADGVKEFYYTHQDHLGGTALATDENGIVVQVYDYYPYGSELINSQLGTTEVHHSFTDKELEDDLGLYYFEARWYDPEIGRFLSADPLDGMSYTYAANNPLILIDPTGLYNVETGEIEEGDTSDSIVQQVNEAYTIETDWETIAEVSFFEENFGTTKIGDLMGQFTYVGTDSVADVTYYLNALIDLHADEAILEDYSLKEVASLFCSGCSWDLKNSDNPVFGTDRSFSAYIYFGNFIRYDAPGNIQYGYVMSRMDYSWFTTSWGAHYASLKDSGTFDEPYDQRMINWGHTMVWK